MIGILWVLTYENVICQDSANQTMFNSLTCELCVQYIEGGGSGLCFTIHVKFIVLPLFKYISGPPRSVVIGSEIKKNQLNAKINKIGFE